VGILLVVLELDSCLPIEHKGFRDNSMRCNAEREQLDLEYMDRIRIRTLAAVDYT
jgi:hypothetical protein